MYNNLYIEIKKNKSLLYLEERELNVLYQFNTYTLVAIDGYKVCGP